MMVFLACRRDLSSRAVAVVAWGSGDAHVQSTATRRPWPQAFGALGAPHLPFGFASKPSPSAPWARGLLSAFWEWGSPDLPACGPRRGYASRPVRPIFINKAFKTLTRGQASRGGRRKTSSRSGGRQRAQRPCFLSGAMEASAGAEYRGIKQRFPYRCNETKTSRAARRRSPWSPMRCHH